MISNILKCIVIVVPTNGRVEVAGDGCREHLGKKCDGSKVRTSGWKGG